MGHAPALTGGVPHVESPFVLRAELLTLDSTLDVDVDRMEAESQFPKRILLEPTNRVAWLRSEVTDTCAVSLSAGGQRHRKIKLRRPIRNLSPLEGKRADPGG